jgi:hypothetical protein
MGERFIDATLADAAAKEVEKIRQLIGEVFDEMHLLFAPALAPTNSVGAPGTPQEQRLMPEARLHY